MELKAFIGVPISANSKVSHMKFLGKIISAGVAFITLSAGCSGGASDTPPGATGSVIPAMGSISISLTDGPWEEPRALVLNITGMDLGHANGDVIGLDLPGGPMSVDMMQLQNGVIEPLLEGVDVPMGHYEWVRLRLDLSQSYIELAGTGDRHDMQMGPNASNGLEAHEPFEILDSIHHEFVLEFDMRRGVQHHHGGMMGDQYELHSAMRLVNMDGAGGVTGWLTHP